MLSTAKAVDPLEEHIINNRAFWLNEQKELQEISEKYFYQMVDATGEEIGDLFKDLGMDVGTAFDIYDTEAPKYLRDRVVKGRFEEISETIRNDVRGAIRTGLETGQTEREMAEGVRGAYNKVQNRAATIARTELGGVINDSRFASYKDSGWEYHSWLSSLDEDVRTGDYNHLIDSETVKLGDRFSNGLIYPNDPDGAAGNVINCRCITLPEQST